MNVPVIAAGGIADATGVAAAWRSALPAFRSARLTCSVGRRPPARCTASAESEAQVTPRLTTLHWPPARGIVNGAIRELGPISPQRRSFRWRPPALYPLRAKAESLGSGDFSPLWCGQNVSGCPRGFGDAGDRENSPLDHESNPRRMCLDGRRRCGAANRRVEAGDSSPLDRSGHGRARGAARRRRHVAEAHLLRLLLPNSGAVDSQGLPGLCAGPGAGRIRRAAEDARAGSSVRRVTAHERSRLDQCRRTRVRCRPSQRAS